MQASDTCKTVVKGYEGLRLSIYADLNGFSTVGFGHKLTHSDVTSGRFTIGITEDQADILFDQDSVPFETGISANSLIVTQGQFDACFSFAYNLGLSNLNVMLSHGIDQVPQQIVRWTHAAGVVQPGLVARRNQELQWWNS